MTTSPMTTTENRAVRLLARATGLVTLILLVAGGLVTSKGAGMAVPDWPTSFGYNMFTFPVSAWIGPIAFEHVHRLLGSTVGLLTVALAVTVWRKDPRGWMRALAVVAVVTVIIQGVLGGLRVIHNAQLLAVIHGSFAHGFFALMIAMALSTTRLWEEANASPIPPERAAGLRGLAVTAAALVYGQILLGARLRHFSGSVMLHLLGAVLVVTAVVAARQRIAMASPRSPAARMAFVFQHMIWLQLLLGFIAYFAKMKAPIPEFAPWPAVMLTVAHQVNGALVFATSISTALLVFRATAANLSSEPAAAEPTAGAGA
ncbi:MAG: COX15/CtaA family protein [Deltaproteobacteria bacterium]|nr:COX15/CtaA family protein [Deltaproteobacteria bacterium]